MTALNSRTSNASARLELTRDRINTFMLLRFADWPGSALDTLKNLRILIRHAIEKGLLKRRRSSWATPVLAFQQPAS